MKMRFMSASLPVLAWKYTAWYEAHWGHTLALGLFVLGSVGSYTICVSTRSSLVSAVRLSARRYTTFWFAACLADKPPSSSSPFSALPQLLHWNPSRRSPRSSRGYIKLLQSTQNLSDDMGGVPSTNHKSKVFFEKRFPPPLSSLPSSPSPARPDMDAPAPTAAPALALEQDDSQQPQQRVLSVAGASNVKSLAGSIAHTSRSALPPKLQSVGPTSLNQAIKAIAVARTFLEANDLDLDVEVSRVADAEIRNLIQLKLIKKARQPAASSSADDGQAATAAATTVVDLRCAAQTETVALAGAISNNVREGKQVRITAIGPLPVFRAVDAIIRARAFLARDDLDVLFSPQFTTIDASEEGGGVVNAVQLCVSSVPLA